MTALPQAAPGSTQEEGTVADEIAARNAGSVEAELVLAFLNRYDLTDDIRPGEVERQCKRARLVMEKLMLSMAHGEVPRPSVKDCADVLTWIYHAEPVNRDTWWQDLNLEVSHVSGFYKVLHVMSESLRRSKEARR